jgi:predicted Fe-Mo cluster-binding NifX family protein
VYRRKKKMKRIFYLNRIIILLLTVIGYASGDDTVRIAVASESNTLSSPVSSKAARCTYYLLFDVNGQFLEAIKNPYKDAAGGAGTSVADFLTGKGVTKVIAESFGSKMSNAMKDKGIEYNTFTGTVEDSIKKFLSPK